MESMGSYSTDGFIPLNGMLVVYIGCAITLLLLLLAIAEVVVFAVLLVAVLPVPVLLVVRVVGITLDRAGSS